MVKPMDEEGQFYIIAGVLMCIALLSLTVLYAITLSSIDADRVSRDIDGVFDLYAESISLSICQDPYLTSGSLLSNLHELDDFLRERFHRRGYGMELENETTGICIYTELKCITMDLNATESDGYIQNLTIELTNSGYGGVFNGSLNITGYNDSISVYNDSITLNISENSTWEGTITDLSSTDVNLILTYQGYTVINESINATDSTKSASRFLIIINGTVLSSEKRDCNLTVEFLNNGSTLPLLNGTGSNKTGVTRDLFLVEMKNTTITFPEIVNVTYNRIEPIIWVTEEVELAGSRLNINSTYPMNVSLDLPGQIKAGKTEIVSEISIELLSGDAVYHRRFTIRRGFSW